MRLEGRGCDGSARRARRVRWRPWTLNPAPYPSPLTPHPYPRLCRRARRSRTSTASPSCRYRADLPHTTGEYDSYETGEFDSYKTGECDSHETGECDSYKTGEYDSCKTGKYDSDKTDGRGPEPLVCGMWWWLISGVWQTLSDRHEMN